MKRKMIYLMLSLSLLLIAAACGANNANRSNGANSGGEEGNGAGTASSAPASDGGKAPESASGHIVWWAAWAPDVPTQMIADFNKKYPDIKVDYVQYANTAEGNLKVDTALLSGQGIDVFFNYTTEMAMRRAGRNLMSDLGPFIEKDKFDVAQELGQGIPQVNGKYYSLPATAVSYAVFINKKMADEAGLAIPESWTLDEYADFAKKLTKGEGADKIYGSSDGVVGDYWTNFVRGKLGKNFMYNSEGKSNFDDPAFKQVLDFKNNAENVEKFQYPYTNYLAAKTKEQETFIEGKVASTVSGNSIVRYIADTEQYPRDFQIDVAPYPVLEKGQENKLLGTDYYGYLGINAKSKEQEASWIFTKWLMTDGSLNFAKVGHVPVWEKTDPNQLVEAMLGADAASKINLDHFKKYVIDSKDRLPVDDNFTASAEIKTIVGKQMQQAMTGQATVDQALQEMKKQSDEAINKQ